MPSYASLFTSDALTTALTWVAAVLYLLGLITLIVRRRHGARREATALDHLPALLGFVCHAAAVFIHARALDRFPVGNLVESASFLALLLAGSYLVAAASAGSPAVEALLLVLIVAFLGLSFLSPVSADPSPALASRWFVFHTLLSLLGITALFAVCILSILYLLADEQLKSKRPGLLLRFLPSLVACDRTALRLLVLGFPLLTLGMVSGWFWSREAGRLEFGPKVVWAIAAWVIYGALLLARLVGGWRGRKAAILGVTGAVAVLWAFFGIRL